MSWKQPRKADLDMQSTRIHFVDVFGSQPLLGNALAVVVEADWMSSAQMQSLTRWLNLSETVFLTSPISSAADYRVRIFTPDRELPFAGHPTLGACHVWLSEGGAPRVPFEIVQECGAGLVPLRFDDTGHLAFASPPLIRSGKPEPDEIAEAAEFLGIELSEIVEARWIDNGPGWLGILLTSAERVLALEPRRDWDRSVDIGVLGPYASESEIAIEVRAFFNDHLGRIVEDPVTGSLNAAVGEWLFETGRVGDRYTARQGTRVARDGLVRVSRDSEGRTWVAGDTRTHISGSLELFASIW